MKELRVLRIVVASPEDVQAERDTLPAIVDELNRSVAADRDVRLELSRWETDCYPGFHPNGAQGLIDPILRADACDILIGIFWKRFGTPVKEAKSGTEHEFRLAYEAWEQSGHPNIMVYFNQKPYAPRSSEEADEWKRVLEFRDAFSKEGLWWSYKGKAQFAGLVRGHLVQFIRNQFPLPSRPDGEREETPHRSTDELTREYRAYLADRVGKVSIFGEAEPRELEEVFVDLDIVDEYNRPSNRNNNQDDDKPQRRGRIPSREYEDDKAKGQEASGYENRRTIKPDELLRERAQAVILGAPGCGKTTLLRYLTGRTLKENERLPVFLELKTITEEGFKEAQNDLAELLFEKAVASLVHLRQEDRERFKESFFTRLRAGEVAIFLDGLDEVSGTDTFPKLCESVREFIHSAYRENSILISTRPYALQARFEGLKEMEIAPLSQRQVGRFLNHYYGDNPVTKQLVQTIRQNSQLGELVRVPFLLAVIAQLYRSQNKIVENRLDLYRQIIWQLVVQLDREKSIDRSRFHVPDLDGSLKLDFLSHLAFERLLAERVKAAQSEPEAERLLFTFTGDVLLENAKQFLEKAARPEISPYLLAADVKAMPLLREIGADVHAFTHLVFQEYLAAVALSKRDDCEEVFCRAYFNPVLAEMEVLPMTLGLVSEPDDFYLALELLPESLNSSNLRLRARGLAYVQKLSQEHLNKMTDRLIHFITSEEMYPYRESVISSFSMANNLSLDFIVDRVASLVREDKGFDTWLAASALGEIGGKRAVDVLLAALNGSNGGARMQSAFALGRMREGRAVDHLRSTLKEQHTAIRWGAAVALGQIGDEQAVEDLLDRLSDEIPLVRQSAAKALGQIGGEQAVTGLHQALTDERVEVRLAAAFGLGVLGDSTAEKIVLEILRDKENESDVRLSAVSTLGEIGSEQSARALFEALNDGIDVRRTAADALGEIGKRGGGGGGEAIDVLLEALKVENNDVRWRTAWELGKIGTKQAVPGLIQALKDREYSGSRWRAAEALGKIGGQEAEYALLETLQDKDNFVRMSAALALGNLGHDEVIDDCLEALNDIGDEKNVVRWRAADALGRIGGKRAVPALLGALRDDALEVREPAAKALARISDEDLSSGLVDALSDPDLFVREKAAQIVGYYSADEAILNKLSSLATSDPFDEVQIAAREASDKFLRKLRYFGEETEALAEEIGREKMLEETRAFIAHEVKNTIGPLRLIAQLLNETLTQPDFDKDKLAEYTERILKQTDAAYEVVNRYVDYAKMLTPQFNPTDVNQLLEKCLNEVSVECERNKVQIELQLRHTSRASIDSVLIEEVFRNALQNALEAMECCGKLTIATRQEAHSILVIFSDTGPGIKPEHLARVFELGFTTKMGKRGAGLGLALIRRIVAEAHNGRVSIVNNPDGGGASLTIELPIAEKDLL